MVAKYAHKNVVKFFGIQRLIQQDNSFYTRYAMAMELCTETESALKIIRNNEQGMEHIEIFVILSTAGECSQAFTFIKCHSSGPQTR